MKQLKKYSVKVSHRAKHVSLKVSNREGLVVVVPQGFNHNSIPEIIQKKTKWITRAFFQLNVKKAWEIWRDKAILPNHIPLHALGQLWNVEYVQSDLPKVKWEEQPNYKLVIKGPIKDKVKANKALQEWLHYKAKECLTPWLKAVSWECGLPYKTVVIKNHKGRWASCSSRKNVNLNRKLLFLPPKLVRYIFVHELCHTRYLNHSANFWNLVAEKEPEYKEIDREVTYSAWRTYVPYWADLKA